MQRSMVTCPSGHRCYRRPSTQMGLPLSFSNARPKRVVVALSGRDRLDTIRQEANHAATHPLEHGHVLRHDSSMPDGRQHQSSTATHAYVSAVPLDRPVRQMGSSASPSAGPQRSQSSTGTTAAGSQNKVQKQQQRRHQVQFESAYTFQAPSWDPLVGCSRQHMRIEKHVQKAAESIGPLVISGDAGLNTLRLAATVHAWGLDNEDVSHPMVVVDCSSRVGATAASQLLLSGPDNMLPGTNLAKTSVDLANDILLLSALSSGTLVLNNIHKAPHSLLALADAAIANLDPQKSLPTAAVAADAAAAAEAAARPGSFLKAHRTRLVLVSQPTLTQLLQQLQETPTAAAAAAAAGDSKLAPGAFASLKKCPSIAVPALQARPSDIGPLAIAAGQGTACLRGYRGIQLSAAALQQLTSYPFPGNEAELKGLVQRAIMLHAPAPGARSVSSFESPLCSCDGEECCSSHGRVDGGCCGKGGCSTGEPAAPVLTLEASDFWAATGKADRARMDVMELFPWLKRFILGTGLWPLGLNKLMMVCYPLVLLSLFLGPQERESSAALTVFWAGWWPLVLLSFPFVGRAWCSICPFMITGEAAQDLVETGPVAEAASGAAAIPGRVATGATTAGRSLAAAAAAAARSSGALGVAAAVASTASSKLQKVSAVAAQGAQQMGWELKRWPTEAIEPWAGHFVVASFAAILLWEHVWDLPGHAALSGWLLVMITGGAVACSMVFEKRLWCRHFCPIGAMNGLFAKLSMTEIRSRPGLCAASACSKPCHKGGVEQQVVKVPATNPACQGSAFPAVPLSFMGIPLPWARSTTPSSCSDTACTSNSCSSSSRSSACGKGAQGTSACSAFTVVDPAGPGRIGSVPTAAGLAAKAPTVAAAAAAGGGVQFQKVDVKLPGCPINTHPGLHKDNHDCIMCGNCLRSCTSGSAQWRLRPPAADLWGDHEASWTEVHLMNVLLGSVLLHSLPDICSQLGLPSEQLLSDKAPHLLLSAALLAAPSALSWTFQQAATAATQRLSGSTGRTQDSTAAYLASIADSVEGDDDSKVEGVSRLRLSYSALPLVWAGVLAHYETMLLTELGLTMPRLAISVGASPDTPWLSLLPAFSPAPAAVVAAAQGATLLLGTAFSMALAGKIGSVDVQNGRVSQAEAGQAVLAQRLLTALIAVELWNVIL